MVALVAVLLLSGCGEKSSGSKGKDKNRTPEVSINYENYTTQAVDRKLADCIETWQVAEVLGCEESDLEVIVPKDSMVDYFVMGVPENPPENPIHLQIFDINQMLKCLSINHHCYQCLLMVQLFLLSN